MAGNMKFITHIALYCANVDDSISWYEDILGMKVRAMAPGRFAGMTFGERHHDMALVQAPPDFNPANRPQVGLYHISVDTGSLDESLRIYDRAKTAGRLVFEKAVDHRVGTGIYIRDPDGNLVELWSEAYGTMKEAVEAIDHFDPPFEENPIGWPLDIEQLWTEWSERNAAETA